MLHITQKHILNQLATAESRRYGELKPDSIDGNVFGYHLKQLLSSGLIEKEHGGSYHLTEAGRKYIVTRNETPLESAHSIFLFVIRCGEHYLVRERKIQPMLASIGFLHGEPKIDTPVTQAAKARLYTKTGLDIDMTVAMSGLVTLKKGGELQSFSHAIVLVGEAHMVSLPIEEDDTGRNQWIHRANFSSTNIIPSCPDILSLLENKRAWFELSYDL